MTADAASAAPGDDRLTLGRERVRWLVSVAFCGVLPALTLVVLFVSAFQDDVVAFDFRPFHHAAGAILDGRTPYPADDVPLTAESGAYVYPPLGALLAIPLHALSVDTAGLVVMALLVAAAAATAFLCGVRDWRCYGLLFLWPPVLSAIQTGNVTLWLGLAAAVAWRLRDRLLPVVLAVGATLAAKFFLWPLVVWLACTRRVRSAIAASVVGVGLLVASWAIIGFAGFREYPAMMRRLEDTIGLDSYTVRIVLLDAGVPGPLARAGWLVLGLLVLGGVVLAARRGQERAAFILAIGAALALTPIVWLHYFALLLVVVAIAQPTLGLVWFVPLGMIVTPGSGHPSPFETAWTLAVAAAVVGLSVRSAAQGRRSVFPRSPYDQRLEAVG